jgi:diketogulonate reductase-like aldo/keto reductase
LGLGLLCGIEEDEDQSENIVSKLAKKYGRTSGQIALNWLLQHENVVALIKSTNSTHVNENVASVGWEMEKVDYELLDGCVL